MKRLATLFALPLVLVACEAQPVGVDTPDAQLAKVDKKPTPASGELITFTGDLEGAQEVSGCCPNAGPFPTYTMVLKPGVFPDEVSGEQTGQIFMNSFGRKAQWDYIVQFWWGDEPEDDNFIEIKGGEVEYDRRTKILKVIFAGERMTITDPDEVSTEVVVDFVLTRAPIG